GTGSALHQEFHSHLADSAVAVAQKMNTHGYSARALRESLHENGIEIPRSDAKDIKEIPGMQQLPRDTKLQPNDVVVWGATAQAPHGGSFVYTKDGQAASDHIASVPALGQFPEVRIFRSKEKE